MPVEGKGERRDRPDRTDTRTGPAAPAPVAPAPAPAPVTQPPAASPVVDGRARQPAPPSPQESAPPPDIPSQAPRVDVPRSEQARPGQRPGTEASQQQLFARAGVRMGAFDPRFRGANEEGRAIASLLGAAGVPQQQAAGVAVPVPPSLGFNPNQFEEEQRILGALRGA